MITEQNIISVKNLTFTYENAEKPAVKNVNLEIHKGDFVAITGANGSGKSTLSKLIFGFLPLQEGIIEIRDSKNFLGFVQQNPKYQIIANIVQKDAEFGPEIMHFSSEKVFEMAKSALEKVDLLEKKNEKTQTLSLGQTQRLALAGILALNPDVLILDEALSMNDEELRNEILRLEDSLHEKGKTIIHITHEISEVKRANRVIVMEKGELLYDMRRNDFEKSQVKNLIFGTMNPAVYERSKKSLAKKSRSKTCNENSEISLVFDNISFSYNKSDDKNADKNSGDKNSHAAVKNVNLCFEKGTITAVMGKSGSGKSTLFELGASLLEPGSGKVFCCGKTALALQDAESALFESVAADDVAFGAENRGLKGAELKNCVKNAMDLCGVPFDEFKDCPILSLSGGEKRKVALAGIIAMDSDIIFFDEPTGNLDPKSREQFLALSQKLADEGKTIIFSTHYDEDALAADRLVRLENGSVIEDTEPVLKNAANESANAANENPKKLNAADENLKEDFRYKEYAPLLKNLRNTTLGQFEEKNSAIHKMSGALKLIVFLVLLNGSVLVPNLWVLAGFCFFSVLYAILAKFSAKKLFMRTVKMIPWIIIFFIFQIFLFKNGENDKVFWSWHFISITDAKLWSLLKMFLHFFGAMTAISVFTFSMEQSELIETLKKFLPQNALVFFMLLFRFIPLLTEELSHIVKTQIVREGIKSTQGIFKKIKAILPVLIPLIIQTIRRSQNFSDALEQRGMRGESSD